MEILVAIATTVVAELAKVLGSRFGMECTKKLVMATVLIGSVVFTVLMQNGVITQDLINSIAQTLTSSIGIYELVVKRVIYPALGLK